MFEETDEARERRLREQQARARSENTRRTIVALLGDGPMSSREIKARLPTNVSMSLLSYHLSVLVEGGAIVRDAETYRLS
jgi:predicted transcriptional regulator